MPAGDPKKLKRRPEKVEKDPDQKVEKAFIPKYPIGIRFRV